jgi:hypothetical protein
MARAGQDREKSGRSVRPLAVAELLPEVGGQAFRRFGFSQGQLVAQWRQVVGAVYAQSTVPESLRPGRGKGVGGTLTIRVEGPFAIHLQHVAPQIIARCNRILGDGAVARLRFVQGSVPGPPQADGPKATISPEPLPNLARVTNPDLRAALEGLAAAIGETKGPPRVR